MKSLTFFLVPAIAALAIACGGNDDTPATATPSPTAPAAETPAPSPTPQSASPTPQPASPTPGQASPTPSAPTATPVSQGSNSPFSFPPQPDPPSGAATLVDVRVGAHPDGRFDRIVFEFDGDRPEGLIEYVEDAAQCGSGFPVEDLDGDAILMVRFQAANAHTEQGQPTVDERELDGPGTTIAEARQICDFEALVEWVVGVEGGERNFVVYLLPDPNRVVIDIPWP